MTKTKLGNFAVQQGGKSTKVQPIEDRLHLQTMVRMAIGGDDIGAYLLRKSPTSPYSIVFGFETEGIHSGASLREFSQKLEQIASGLNDFVGSDCLTIHLMSDRDDTPRQVQLKGLKKKCRIPEIKFLLTGEQALVQHLSRQGLRESKRIRLFITYRDTTNQAAQNDAIDRALLRADNFLSTVGGKRTIVATGLEWFLRTAFYSGFRRWYRLLATKLGIPVRPIGLEDMWEHAWRIFNRESPCIPVPQVVTLATGGLTEEATSQIHPSTLLCADGVPVLDRKWVRARKQYQGIMTFWDKPGGWKSAQTQLSYLSTLLNRDEVHDTDIICQIRPASSTLATTATQQIIKESNVSADKAEEHHNLDVAAKINMKRAADAQAELYEGNMPFYVAVAIVARRPTLVELDEACAQIQDHFHRPAWVVRETSVAWKLWLQTLPIVDQNLLGSFPGPPELQYLSTEVPGLMPIVSTHSPANDGLELIAEDGGTPLFLNIFTPDKHENIGIFGITRSGKSVFVSGILTHALAQEVPVPIVAIDYPKPDGSSTFIDYTHFFGERGAYMDIGNQALNLFDRPNVSALPRKLQLERFEDYKDFLCSSVLTLVMPNQGEGMMHTTTRTILYTALNAFFSDPEILARYEAAEASTMGSADWNKVPTLRDFREFCTIERLQRSLQLEEGISWNLVPQAIEQIRLRLTYWLGSRVGKAISSPSTVSSEAALLVFALRNISQNEDAAIMALCAYAAAFRRALGSLLSIFFIDESPILFAFPEIARIVGWICANGAKSGIRVIITAQEPDTIFNCIAGKQIYANLTTRMIGRINKDSVASFVDLLKYPQEIVGKCPTFYPHGLYSMWLLDNRGKYTQCRYYPAKVQLGVVANNQDEQKVRTAFLSHYPDKYEAIAEFSNCLEHAILSKRSVLEVAAMSYGIKANLLPYEPEDTAA